MTSLEDGPILFYDGHCGLCHRAVLFILRHELAPDAPTSPPPLRFAPLFGPTFEERVPEHLRATLPDSLLLLLPDGSLHTRSTAVLHILPHLKTPWSSCRGVLRVLPRPLRDLGYRIVARVRRWIFKPPADTCPLVPEELRGRMLG